MKNGSKKCLSFSMFFLDFFLHQTLSTLRLQNMKICFKLFFSVWSSATQPVQKSWDTKKLMQIDFEDVHNITGWSTEDVDYLMLHKKLPDMKQFSSVL